MALELALSRVPMAVAYRLNPLTEALLDRIVRVRQVNLVNLLLGERLVPEHLRRDCAPEPIAASLAALLRDERVRSAHLAAMMRRCGGCAATAPRPAGTPPIGFWRSSRRTARVAPPPHTMAHMAVPAFEGANR